MKSLEAAEVIFPALLETLHESQVRALKEENVFMKQAMMEKQFEICKLLYSNEFYTPNYMLYQASIFLNNQILIKMMYEGVEDTIVLTQEIFERLQIKYFNMLADLSRDFLQKKKNIIIH